MHAQRAQHWSAPKKERACNTVRTSCQWVTLAPDLASMSCRAVSLALTARNTALRWPATSCAGPEAKVQEQLGRRGLRWPIKQKAQARRDCAPDADAVRLVDEVQEQAPGQAAGKVGQGDDGGPQRGPVTLEVAAGDCGVPGCSVVVYQHIEALCRRTRPRAPSAACCPKHEGMRCCALAYTRALSTLMGPPPLYRGATGSMQD